MKRMNTFKLALIRLWNRRSRLAVQWIMVILGFGLVSGFFSLQQSADDQLVKDIASIDQVWTAKGSPLQGLLANVYHMDAPLGNIPLSELDEWSQNPMVERITRISYGDTYQGRRILGADPSWKDLYDLSLVEGHWPENAMEVVISESIATQTGLTTGSTFQGQHGATADEHVHEEEYHVTGIYATSGTVADRILLTTLESVWHVHHSDQDHLEVTAALVETSSPMALFQLPRQINSKSTFQAILPSIEVNRIYSLLGNTRTAFLILSALFLCLGAVSIALTLYETMRAQQFDHTLLRVFGLSPARLGMHVFIQCAVLLITAWMVGIGLIKTALWWAGPKVSLEYGLQLERPSLTQIDWIMLAISAGIAILIAVPVIIRIFRMTIHKNLNNA